MKKPVRVAVTGAAGQIGYSLLFRIASGQMLGSDQPVILQLLELPDRQGAGRAQGRDDGTRGLRLPAARRHERQRRPESWPSRMPMSRCWSARAPRGPGMERKDLLLENAKIFTAQGKALDAVARPRRQGAGGRQPGQHQRLHRDAIRTVAAADRTSPPCCGSTTIARCSQLAAKAGVAVGSIERLIVWGNHSPTMYPDYRFATRRRRFAQGHDQRRGLEPQRVHPDGRQARRRRSSRRADCPRPRRPPTRRSITCATGSLGSDGKWVTMGVASDGSYGIPTRRHVRLSGHHRRRRVHARAGTGNRRVFARTDGRDAQRARRGARRRRLAPRAERRHARRKTEVAPGAPE